MHARPVTGVQLTISGMVKTEPAQFLPGENRRILNEKETKKKLEKEIEPASLVLVFIRCPVW